MFEQYIPTGDTVVCMDERSQYANKCKAFKLLENIINNDNRIKENSNSNKLRVLHTNLERGNAVVKFEGEKFKRIY